MENPCTILNRRTNVKLIVRVTEKFARFYILLGWFVLLCIGSTNDDTTITRVGTLLRTWSEFKIITLDQVLFR